MNNLILKSKKNMTLPTIDKNPFQNDISETNLITQGIFSVKI